MSYFIAMQETCTFIHCIQQMSIINQQIIQLTMNNTEKELNCDIPVGLLHWCLYTVVRAQNRACNISCMLKAAFPWQNLTGKKIHTSLINKITSGNQMTVLHYLIIRHMITRQLHFQESY